MNKMLDIQVASDNKTVDVGPGARWVDVYSALAPYDLYCIGGRLKTIGVAGLELIGGFHYFNNKYGMAMDNVVSYDVVLGNGTQIVANASSHTDLFWALKGGANNFGVVTNFKIKTMPISRLSTSIQSFDESHAREFIEATANLALHDSPDLAAGSVITLRYNMTTRSVDCAILGVQEGTESPPSSFANFTAIPALSRRDAVVRPIDWHANLDSPFQMFRLVLPVTTLIQ